MDFQITEEQRGLVASLREVLERECPRSLIRDVVEALPAERPERARPVWDQAVQLGWPALIVPEDAGGLGLGYVELVLAFEEFGRAATPGPFLGTLGQFVPAVLEVGTAEQQHRWLPAIAEGRLTGTLAIAEDGRWDVTPRCTAKPDGDGFRLDGTKTHVVDADVADELLVSAAVDGGLGLFVVPGEAVETEPVTTLDATRPVGTVRLDGVSVGPERVLGTPGDASTGLERALAVATTALAAEMVGTCQALFDMTLDYTKVRQQFDRPIGSFQALKHILADAYVLIERARAVVHFAAMTLAEDDDRQMLAAAMAKAAAGDAQRAVAAAGIQLHGGIAYTWEHDAQLLVKRIKASDALLGNAQSQRQRIADLLDAAAPAA